MAKTTLPARAKKQQALPINEDDAMRSRMIFAVLQTIKTKGVNEVSAMTRKSGDNRGVSPDTIRRWYLPVKKGGTRYPSSRTLESVATAMGYHFEVKKNKPNGGAR